MRKYLSIIVAFFAATALALGGALTASAADWSANGDSHVIDANTIHLEGDNTSVETGSVNLTVDAGAEVSFRYTLHDGAECTGGAPRVFVIVDGQSTNSWDGNDGQCGTDGRVSFTIPNAGGVAWVGVVYDNAAGGYVRVSDLKIGGQAVPFAAASDEDENGDEGDNGNGGDETENGTDEDEKPNGAGGNGTTKPNGTPVPVPTTVPAGVGTLPETGPAGTALVLLGLLGAVLVAGGGLLAWQQQRTRPGRYRA